MVQKYPLPKNIRLPKHVVIIPDGNRRWARSQGKPTFFGHQKGFDVATQILRAGRQMGVHTMTIWAFSTGNWDRSKTEINYLMRLYASLIDTNLKEAIKDKVRIIHLGRKDRIPKYLLKKITDAEEKTKDFTNNILNIALDHGGHDDIIRNLNANPPSQFTERSITNLLDTRDQPHPQPDLIIRTSGEQRTSGILCWQAEQAEMYWINKHFPDFTPKQLAFALIDYSRRRRRFGGNDKELHLKFNPKKVARAELEFYQSHHRHQTEQMVKSFIKLNTELYQLKPASAKQLIKPFLKAIKGHDTRNKKLYLQGMKKVYSIIQHDTGFSFDPNWVARLDIDGYILHDQLENEPDKSQLTNHFTELIAEIFRINRFQAQQAAYYKTLAFTYHDLAEKPNIPAKQEDYWWSKTLQALETSYTHLKDKVA